MNKSEFEYMAYGAIKIYENQMLVIDKEIKRNWKERWFTKPWHPFKKTRVIQVPNMQIYSLGDNQVVMHPERKRLLMQEIDEYNMKRKEDGTK